jgi:hypothetical protein
VIRYQHVETAESRYGCTHERASVLGTAEVLFHGYAASRAAALSHKGLGLFPSFAIAEGYASARLAE